MCAALWPESRCHQNAYLKQQYFQFCRYKQESLYSIQLSKTTFTTATLFFQCTLKLPSPSNNPPNHPIIFFTIFDNIG